MARALAQDGTWRRLLTDPATGLVCEVGSVTYRPGADLTRTVIARDVTCTFPGCRQPATRCDLDHIIAFDHDRPAENQTCADNLHALCRHHHRAKTERHWQVERDPTTGTTWWTDHHGTTYARSPVRVLVAPSAMDCSPPPPPPPDEPPPF